MSKLMFLPVMFCLTIPVLAQTYLRGSVVDLDTHLPIEGATITIFPSNTSAITDQSGRFIVKGKFNDSSSVTVNSIGYALQTFSIASVKQNSVLSIRQKQILLQDVVVTGTGVNQYKPISKTDIAMRAVNNSQEVLRIIPGIVIGQHQGGGKAEQLFLRGFDADHGTDFRMDVDGLPINMVSHAHGQGFADSHFIIPETIESADFKKGPYTASKGDFATTGFVDFNTRDILPNNLVKLEAGTFDTYRGLGMFNLLGKKTREKQQSWYAATEYRYSNSFFDDPQHFNRFNFFTKYKRKLSSITELTLSATTFWSKWDASGQIPTRAVDQGVIGFYGAIDPTEGGLTYRTNANAQLVTSLKNGGVIKNQVYYSNAHFDLHTNFTFFLEDPVNGDQIRQREARNLLGYNGSYHVSSYINYVRVTTEAGINIRSDHTLNSELSHTKNRYTVISPIKLGDINELSISPYLSETFTFNKHLTLNGGLRFDQFNYKYNNKLASDTTLSGAGVYKASANTVSPTLNLYYHLNDRAQFYLTTGKGFHSNDTRSSVVVKGADVLPSAYSADLGTIFKPSKDLIINLAAWYIYLQQEFVYSGDGGFVDFSGKTRRYGFDFSGRYQPARSLYFDVDVNYAHGRTLGTEKGQDYIPLAPQWTSSGGLTLINKTGLNGSLRYRYVDKRPGNEDYSLTAAGYFVTDAVLNYTKPAYEIGLVINNLFNTKWKETQFDTETRLMNETAPVDEICFTPGTPFSAKLSLTLFFR